MLANEEIERLVSVMETFGGAISWRTLSDGSLRPYEINIALTDAMRGTAHGEDGYLEQRFLSIHAIMLALEGIPGIYIHSFLGTRNDRKKLENSGNNRAINRHCWDYEPLQQALESEGTLHRRIFEGMKHLCRVRQQQPAFNPNATQFTLHLGSEVFAFWRQSLRRDQSIFCLNNITDKTQVVDLSQLNLVENEDWRDLLSGRHYPELRMQIEMAPYQSIWLTNFDGADQCALRSVGVDNPFVSEPSMDPAERRRMPN